MSQGIEITRLLNFPIDSNCYIIAETGSESCIVVDPAQGDGSSLISYLFSKNLNPDFIVLTHEHFDHISSVECLRRTFNCKVISSAKCSESITNSKKNLSLFFDQKGFFCLPADLLIEKNNHPFVWRDLSLDFYLTPGHSEGGICFSLENNLFTGDTLMQTYKAIVKLPGGNRRKLEESVGMLLKFFGGHTMIFPGHGEIFKLSELNINVS